jgi:hypothetical protein
VAALVVALAACHKMETMPAEKLNSTVIDRVWVTQNDHTTFVLHAPRLMGDTLQGFVDGQYRELLLDQTQVIKRRTPAPARTAILGVTLGVAALSGFVYMANRNYVGDGQTCYAGRDGIIVPCCAGKSTISC